MTDLQKWYKEHGICPKCGQRRGFNGHVCCEICLEKNQLNNIKYQSDPERVKRYNDKANKRKMSQYYQCKSQGICTTCHKKQAAKGQLCLECWRKRQNRREKEKIGRLRRGMHWAEKKAQGRCFYCEKPAIEGKCFCEEHLKYRQDVFKKHISKMSESWRKRTAIEWDIVKSKYEKRSANVRL